MVALTRLAYQFAREIGEEALCDIEKFAMLLKTKSREVVKSVPFLSMFVTTLTQEGFTRSSSWWSTC